MKKEEGRKDRRKRGKDGTKEGRGGKMKGGTKEEWKEEGREGRNVRQEHIFGLNIQMGDATLMTVFEGLSHRRHHTLRGRKQGRG